MLTCLFEERQLWLKRFSWQIILLNRRHFECLFSPFRDSGGQTWKRCTEHCHSSSAVEPSWWHFAVGRVGNTETLVKPVWSACAGLLLNDSPYFIHCLVAFDLSTHSFSFSIPPLLCILLFLLRFQTLQVGSDRTDFLCHSRRRRLIYKHFHVVVFSLCVCEAQKASNCRRHPDIGERASVGKTKDWYWIMFWSRLLLVGSPAEPHNWLWAIDRVTGPAVLVY